MLNSLDSIEHVVACLQRKYPNNKFSVDPFYTHNLEEMEIVSNADYSGLEGYNENKWYFGVLTVAQLSYWYSATDNLVTEGMAVLLEEGVSNPDAGDNPNVIKVAENSQIVVLMRGIMNDNYPSNETDYDIDMQFTGQFRGFEITKY